MRWAYYVAKNYYFSSAKNHKNQQQWLFYFRYSTLPILKIHQRKKNENSADNWNDLYSH
jgi:hypothetical protein